ncbi:Atp-dependent protease subunit hslv, partial [Globisporangium splendens]
MEESHSNAPLSVGWMVDAVDAAGEGDDPEDEPGPLLLPGCMLDIDCVPASSLAVLSLAFASQHREALATPSSTYLEEDKRMLARSLLRSSFARAAQGAPTAAAANGVGAQVARFSSTNDCLIGDGQVSLGDTVVKPNAKKVRRINENIVAGFAGSTADAFTLMERLESKLDEYPGQLARSCVELAKAWRTDKYLRRLELAVISGILQAILIVSDSKQSYTLTGNGDVIEPHDGIIGIGSGGTYALAAARALIDQPNLDAEEIGRKAMQIAADICVYTNHNFIVEVLDESAEKKE